MQNVDIQFVAAMPRKENGVNQKTVIPEIESIWIFEKGIRPFAEPKLMLEGDHGARQSESVC